MSNAPIWLLLDDPNSAGFHKSLVDEAKCWAETQATTLGSKVNLEVRWAHGNQEFQRQQASKVADQMTCEGGLVVLLPVDSDALRDLLETLNGSGSQSRGKEGRQSMHSQLVCAVLHHSLSPALTEACRQKGWQVFSVAADQVKMGEIQAEQVLALLGERRDMARRILYITGPENANATRLRIAGAVELLLKSEITVEARHAEWDGSNAREVVETWQAAGGSLEQLDLVAAHCDEVAKAVKEYLRQLGYPEIPVLGMDGTELLGKPLVDGGLLNATVVQPLGMRVALETHACLVSGTCQWEEIQRGPNIRLKPSSYPALSELSATTCR